MIKENSAFSVLYISSVEDTFIFWKELGIEVKEKTDEKVVINLGGFEIHYILESTEAFDEYTFATVNENRGRGVLNYFEVDDLARFFEDVSSLDPEELSLIQANHWTAEEFLFSDPDGYLFVAYEIIKE